MENRIVISEEKCNVCGANDYLTFIWSVVWEH